MVVKCLVWVTYNTERSSYIHRLCFEVIPYRLFFHHAQCPQGWRCDSIKVCIHDYAFSHKQRATRPKRGLARGRGFHSKIYCDTDVTLTQVKACLHKYLVTECSALAETIKMEVV